MEPFELLRWDHQVLDASQSVIEQRSHAMPHRSINQSTP